MNKVIYASIAVIGLVVSMMYYFVAENVRMGNSLVLATVFAMCTVYFVTEWRFYNRHNAMLASYQFLLIPYLILLIGNLLAPFGIYGEIVGFSINFLGLDLISISSHTSLLLAPPAVISLQFTNRYYRGNYPGFVIRRRTYGPKLLPLLFHIGIITAVAVSSSWFGYFDFIVLLFLVASSVQIFSKFVLPRLRRIRFTRSTSRRRLARQSYLEGITESSTRRNRSTRGARPSSRTDSTRSGSTPRSSRSISTTPREGYRQIPVRSRNATTQTRSAPSQVSIDNGLDMSSTNSVKTQKVANTANLLPSGNIRREDLKCIVCYEDFNGKSGSNVAICPFCKFPSHEIELKSWLSQSSRCPRCNKEIRSVSSINSNYLISERQYSNLIRNFKK